MSTYFSMWAQFQQFVRLTLFPFLFILVDGHWTIPYMTIRKRNSSQEININIGGPKTGW